MLHKTGCCLALVALLSATPTMSANAPAVELVSMRISSLKEQYTFNKSLGIFRVTDYCSCPKCCGQYSATFNGKGAGNLLLEPGISIAAPKSFAFGTQLLVDNRECIVADRTAEWVQKREPTIDIYFSTHQEAVSFGLQYIEVFQQVTVLVEKEGSRDNAF